MLAKRGQEEKNNRSQAERGIAAGVITGGGAGGKGQVRGVDKEGS